MSENRRYNNLDGLRTLAAIGIVAFHVLVGIGYRIPGGTVLTYITQNILKSFKDFAQMFFVISGFSMCCGYYDKIRQGNFDLNKFYSKRYLRIFPFFALLVIIDLCASIILESSFSIGLFYEVFSNLTLAYGFFTVNRMSVIGVGWALGVIFGFYIIFPFFVYLIWTKKRAWVSLIVTYLIAYVSRVYFNTKGALVFTWLCFFIAGGIIYLYRNEIEKITKHKFLVPLFIIFGLVIAFVIKLPGESAGWALLSVLLPLVGFSLVVAGGGIYRDSKLLYNPFSRFVSSISLEIYLSHMMIYKAIRIVKINYIFGESIWSYIITFVTVFAGAVLFAQAYRITEKNIVSKFAKNKLKTNKK